MDNQQPSNKKIFFQVPESGKGFIYKYTSPNGKVYIGQTINSLAQRAKNITSGIGYKKCKAFWNAIQKYQFQNFQVDILEEVKVDQLNDREAYYIKKFNSIAPYGYNLTEGGQAGKKIGIYVYSTQNGEFLEHYNSLSEASLWTGVPVETISSIINSKSNRRISHNLTFSKVYLDKFDISSLSRSNYKKVYVYDLDGKLINEFSTVVQASQYLHIAECTIYRHLLNKQQTCGYYFRESKQEKIIQIEKNKKAGKKVCQIEPSTYKTIAVYGSMKEAALSVGLSSGSSIKRAIDRNGKAKGFYWRLIEGSTTTYSENPTESVRGILMDEDIV